MKSKFHFWVINIVFVLLFSFFTSDIKANYSCAWVGVSPSIGTCRVGSASCGPGEMVPDPSVCEGKPYAFCIAGGSFACAANTTYTCVVSGGKCVPTECGPGWTVPYLNYCIAIPAGPCAVVKGAGIKFGCNPSFGSEAKFASGPPIKDCGIETAIGCIPIINNQGLAGFFLRWGLGLGAGISLILMVFATYGISTSAGDPRKLQAAKELLYAAIAGLLLLVMSAYILNFIGRQLLGIL